MSEVSTLQSGIRRLLAMPPEDRQRERERICRDLHTKWGAMDGLHQHGYSASPFARVDGDLSAEDIYGQLRTQS